MDNASGHMSTVKLQFKSSRFVVWFGTLSGIAFFLLVALLYSSKTFPDRDRHRGLNPHRLPPSLERRPPKPCGPVPVDESWEFQAWRDAENYGLSDEQCEAAFPKLFVEIDKAIGRRRTNITFEDLDSQKQLDGMVRGMVYNGEVRIFPGTREVLHLRTTATHHPCRRATRLQISRLCHITFTPQSSRFIAHSASPAKYRVHLSDRGLLA